ncbi:MAG: hypothetical protein DI606_13790 [Sphingobium sp.]|uniref:hypothetical protein n=1 Tax=Sphingobium sp. TaxID=1912891 RepID=UPI000DB44B13|nr:hypothetical protein [Sphingobium sp.]PZU09429.1 MAG: hypothetical protein DI606_13790 [Sphingobium sp.]
MTGQLDRKGLFNRWRARLSQALLREPAVVLLERDGDEAVSMARCTPPLFGEQARIHSSL